MGTNLAGSWQKAVKLLQDCSTRQAHSAEAEAALHDLIVKLDGLPTPPKAVWKKLVQQLQVPLQLATAFTAAAQNDWKSPVTPAAMYALHTLLQKASDAGIASNTGSGSLGSSIREQLQQSGMLQQLTAVLAAMTAECRAETAAIAAGGWDTVPGGDAQQLAAALTLRKRLDLVVDCRWLMWEFWEAQAASAATTWIWGPDGLAVAVMQFTRAGLQYVSSTVQHLLPAVCARSSQRGAALQDSLQYISKQTGTLCLHIAGASDLQQQGQERAGPWQQLLQSPHLLPCVAAVVVMLATDLGRSVTAHSARAQGTSCSDGQSRHCGSASASASAKELDGSSSSSSGAAVQPEQQQQQQGDRSSVSSGTGDVDCTLTACQRQLLQLLSLTPDTVQWAFQKHDTYMLHSLLDVALIACYDCCDASWKPRSSSSGPGVFEAQQQRWQFELQLWRLLPTVLLPCASSLLLPGAPHPTQAAGDRLVQQLLRLSKRAAPLSAQLSLYVQNLGTTAAMQPAAWTDELLSLLLKLAGQLLFQQSPILAGATATPAASGSSSSSSASQYKLQLESSSATSGALLMLLSCVAKESHELSLASSSNGNSKSSSNKLDSAAAEVLPVTKVFVEFTTALEAALRAVSSAVQSSVLSRNMAGFATVNYVVTCVLLRCFGQSGPALMPHMGLRGPEALAQEQQQLYSLLSTVQKLPLCVQPGDQWPWQDEMRSCCCLAAAYAAVSLLAMGSAVPTGGSAADQTVTESPVAAVKQPAMSFLPSLVLFGRCLRQWAGQLQQHAPDLLLLGPGDLQQTNEGHLYDYSAARVCIPGLRPESTLTPGQHMESLARTVREWVGGIELPASAQLTAAGCSPQQLQQQLDALLSAQQGTQQGLTDASLAALVQQLQATGAMLSSIAVPPFCNNPACTNLSGPSEVRLVSGRSCICAGCHIARYCGRACQRAAWKQHKPVCKALAAAASSTAATVGE